MPYYDFYCKGCKILIEDEFFKIADEKNLKCDECDEQMEQVILKAQGLSHTSDPDPNEAVKRNHERQVKTETKTAKELGVSVKKSKPPGLFKYDK